MSITNPSPNVLINGLPQTNGVDIVYSDAQTTFQLEDAAGVNVWVLECIGADEINTPFLDTINANITYISGDSRQMQNNTIRGAHGTALPTGTALIFRSTVNNGIDINGNFRDDFICTFGVYIRTDDTYGIPGNDLRVGATNETIEGNEATGWTSKLDELIRLVGQPILASVNYPGIIKLAGDLEGTGLVPRVGHLQGHSFEPNPEADQVFVAPFGTYDIEWRYLVNANIDANANISSTKLAPGAAGQVLMSNTTPQATWMTIDQDISLDGNGIATLTKIRGKNTATSLASIGAAQDGYVLTWNYPSLRWEALPSTGGGGGGSVSWAGDLLGSTDVTQRVTHITGSTGGIFGVQRGVDLGNGSDEFVLIMQPIASGTPPTLQIYGTVNNSGDGGAVKLFGGNGSAGASVGGDLTLGGGYGATENLGGSTSIIYRSDGGTSSTLASFSKTATSITAAAKDSTASLTLNSGSGGTSMYSDNNIGITASSNLVLTTAAADIILDAKVNTTIKTNGNTCAQFNNGLLTLGRFDTDHGVRQIAFTDSDYTVSAYHPVISQSSASHHGSSLTVQAQSASSGTGNFNGGPLQLRGGLKDGTGLNGPVNIWAGTSVNTIFGDGYITMIPLSGSGSGYISVDNTGLLSFISYVPPGGSAGGDLSGSYPNPTVAKINGISVASAPMAGDVLYAINGTSASWDKISNSNVSSSAAIVYSKLNLSNSIVNADVNASAAIAYSKLALTGSIVNADVNASAAIAYSKLNLSGSIVNADISSSAAIDVSKLAPGTGGQFLINNTTPTPTWVTLADDVILSNTSGSTRVIGFGHGTASDYDFPTSAGSTGNTMYISAGGVLSFGAVNLAGGSDYVTGTLPTVNQANQSMGGDVSGTTASATVDKIKNRVVHDTTPNDGDILSWDNANSYWKYVALPASGVTWANDLSTSSDTHQYISEISGNAGGGGTVALNITTLSYATDQSSPTIKQADKTTNGGSGQALTIQAQNETGTTSTGGNLILTSGTGTSATGDLSLQCGGVDRLRIFANGVIQLTGGVGATYGTGIIHSDSSGYLSSSAIINADVDASAAIAYSKLNLSGSIVNADVSSSAAIAVSKLAAGTAAQILLNNSTPTPTWTTVSGDATISNTGAVTVTAIQNQAVKSQALGAGQDSYVLTWVNANSRWEAQPQTGGGGGVTTVGTFDSQTSAANGLVISGSSIYAQSATASNPGMIKLAGDIGGSGSAPVVKTMQAATTATKTADYTITTSDYHIFCNFSAAHNLTLPTPANGMTYHVWDISGTAETNNITLVRHASEKISGVAASRVLSTNWGHWMITTDGTDWYVG